MLKMCRGPESARSATDLSSGASGESPRAEQSYMDEGGQILELARNAQRLFKRQAPREKRRLLNFLLSNCSWVN